MTSWRVNCSYQLTGIYRKSQLMELSRIMSSTSDYSTKSNFEGLGTNDVIDSSSGPLRQVASTLDKNSYSSLERDHQNDGWYKSELPGKEEVARYDAEYFMKIVSLEKHRKVEKFSDSSYENPNIQAVSYVKKRIVDTDQGDSRSNWSKVDKQSVHVEFSKRVSPKRFQHDEKGCSFFTKKMEQEIRKARTDYAMKDAGICSITDCTEVAVSGSLCSVHGQGIRCDIPHCGKLAVSRKRCRRHGGTCYIVYGRKVMHDRWCTM